MIIFQLFFVSTMQMGWYCVCERELDDWMHCRMHILEHSLETNLHGVRRQSAIAQRYNFCQFESCRLSPSRSKNLTVKFSVNVEAGAHSLHLPAPIWVRDFRKIRETFANFLCWKFFSEEADTRLVSSFLILTVGHAWEETQTFHRTTNLIFGNWWKIYFTRESEREADQNCHWWPESMATSSPAHRHRLPENVSKTLNML